MREKIPVKLEYYNSVKQGLEKIGYMARGMTGLNTPKEIDCSSWRFHLPYDIHMKKLPVAFMGKDYLEFLHDEERITETETYRDHHIRIKKIVHRIQGG